MWLPWGYIHITMRPSFMLTKTSRMVMIFISKWSLLDHNWIHDTRTWYQAIWCSERPYPRCTESVIFFFYTSSLRHSMDSTMNAIEYFSAYNSPQSLKLASITLYCLLYLQHKFWLKTVSFVAAEISTHQMYQLFFRGIYYHTPILLMVVLSAKKPS